MINIVLSSIHYPMAMSTYFWRALARRKDIKLTTVGPYTGSWIPWNGGMTLPAKYAIPPTIPLDSTFHAIYNPRVLEAVIGEEPDLWLQVDAGYHAGYRPKAKVVATVATDPHVLNYDLPRTYSDHFFCMQTPYMRPDADYWLPYACDPVWHAPLPETREISCDSALIGLLYSHRVQWIQALRGKGYNIRAETGLMGDEYREVYSGAAVGICWSSLKDLPARVFELMGMGLCPIINRVPDLHPLFEEGVHYLGFDTLEEGVEQFERAMKDQVLREKIGKEASYQVHSFHTWDIRIRQILEACGL